MILHIWDRMAKLFNHSFSYGDERYLPATAEYKYLNSLLQNYAPKLSAPHIIANGGKC